MRAVNQSIMQAFGPCGLCGETFSFNPLTVPSTSALTGEREPLCRACVDAVNEERQRRGDKPFEIAADAYDAAEVD